MKNMIQGTKRFEIETYRKPKRGEELRKNFVPFSGSPLKHPHDPERILLVVDPLGPHNLYYEFASKDVSSLEELPSISSVDGKIVTMVRLWVKKNSVAVLSIPFLVGETRTDLPSPHQGS